MSEATETAKEVNSIEIAAQLTAAWLSNPSVRPSAEEALTFITEMKKQIDTFANPVEVVAEEPEAKAQPAVSVKKSLASDDHIISLIDGKPYRTLRRHLATHGLTPEQYRERFDLKPDYPMVARSYSEKRREMAKKIGLGNKRGSRKAAQAA